AWLPSPRGGCPRAGGWVRGFSGAVGRAERPAGRAVLSEPRAGDSERPSTRTSLESSWSETSGSRGSSDVTSFVGGRAGGLGRCDVVVSSGSGGAGSGRIGGLLPVGLR